MTNYDVHEFAELVPAMSDSEYERFRNDIVGNGLRDPIILFEEKILDGRHRQRACVETGIVPRYSAFSGDSMAAIAHVVSENIQRRQLTSSQRALLAVSLKDFISQLIWKQRNQKIGVSRREKYESMITSNAKTTSRSSRVRAAGVAGKLLGVGESQVLAAIRLLALAKDVSIARDVVGHVRDGKLTLNAGASLMRKLAIGDVTESQAFKILDVAVAQRSEKRAAYAVANGIKSLKNAKRLTLQAARSDDPKITLHAGRFQDIDLEPGSVDWIITDPPYGTKYVELYAEFSTWAARVLSPGGSAFVMIGQGAMDRTLPALCRSLNYLWTVGYTLQPGSPFTPIPSLHLVSGWKPVIWLCNGARPNVQFSNSDSFISKIGERDKSGHAWQQGQGFFDWAVSKFTLNTHTICDPFLGTGTTGVSCKRFGRHFVGIEADRDRLESARDRISGTATLTISCA